MNTENFKPLKGIDIDFIEEKQMDIMFQYEPSEREVFKNFDIDTYEDQEVFKKYCWRVTEEITEALEDVEHKQHFKEEITDAFNFLIELYNLYGWSLKKLEFSSYKEEDFNVANVELISLEVIKSLGLTANILKNRKWRKSQYLVDLFVFEKRLAKVWEDFKNLLKVSGISKEDLIDQWSLKYQVNKHRLESNY